MSVSVAALTQLVCRGLVLLLCLPIHEFAHAISAHALGDDTAKKAGRLTLNPFRSIDPLGALSMILLGIGWAKPVPICVGNFRHPRLGMAFVALMGPLSNLALALVGMIGWKTVQFILVMNPLWSWLSFLLSFCYYFTTINVMLAVFNLIPIPPLDGSRLLMLLLPNSVYEFVMRYEHYGMFVLIVLLMLGILNVPLQVCSQAIVEFLNTITYFFDIIESAVVGAVNV